jgi:hypothetical protein
MSDDAINGRVGRIVNDVERLGNWNNSSAPRRTRRKDSGGVIFHEEEILKMAGPMEVREDLKPYEGNT